jgi:hypothetical protein
MLARNQGSVETELEMIISTLHRMRVSVRGPVITPKKNHIFFVDGCILTESEVLALDRVGKLNIRNVRNLLNQYSTMQKPLKPGPRNLRFSGAPFVLRKILRKCGF